MMVFYFQIDGIYFFHVSTFVVSFFSIKNDGNNFFFHFELRIQYLIRIKLSEFPQSGAKTQTLQLAEKIETTNSTEKKNNWNNWKKNH